MKSAPLLEEHAGDEHGGAVVLAPSVEMFQRFVSDPNASVDKIERLMALWERNEARVAESAFNAAMSAAQKKMRPVAADAFNPQTRSKYASYEALDLKLRPIYTEHDFGLSFDTADCPLLEHVRVQCYVTHAAGHSRTYHVDMPADGKGAKGGDVMTKTHAVGAAMAYGMRYLLKMIFNVAVGEEDKDGNTGDNNQRTTPDAPKGYDDWLIDYEATAAQGLTALEAAWKASKPQYRDYLTRYDSQKRANIKAKAQAVRS